MEPLIASANSSMSQSARPSTPSSHFRMPHVFVVPPEEEQQDNPPWCCFDADEQPANNDGSLPTPNIRSLDVPYHFQQSENDVPIPLAHRTPVHQPRQRVPLSRRLGKKQRPEAIQIVENKPSHSRQRDSDVIEVVKVKRGREALTDLEENTKVKRTKTLKLRATKALQSIKNVGKTPRRTHVKDLWTSSESMPRIVKGMQEQIRPQQAQTEDRPPSTPPKKRSLSRANSRSLSQIFQPMKPPKIEPSFSARVPSSVAHPEAYNTLPAVNPSSLSHLRSLNEIPNTLMADNALNRPISPIPSTKKNTLTRFSVRDLHRLFSFSSSSPDDPLPSPPATAGPSLSAQSSSKPSAAPSTFSCDYPDDPMEEDIFADAYFVNLDSPDRKLASQYYQGFSTRRDGDLSTPRRRLSDLSFEMKLDSLHFDTLSFDPDEFGVSREGNILR